MRGRADGDHRPDGQGQGRIGRGRQARRARQARRRRGSRRSPSWAAAQNMRPRAAAAGRERRAARPFEADGPLALPRYELGEKVATRKAYRRRARWRWARRGREIVVLDGEVGNSTYTEIFAKAHPERFFQMYIAEQQMIGAAVGMQVRGWRPHSPPRSPRS